MARRSAVPEQLDLLASSPRDPVAARAKRDDAIERADATVTGSLGGEVLIMRIIGQLAQLSTFTADDVAERLDAAGVSRDLKTRRRLTSTIVNRGRNKLWMSHGFEVSDDPRRNARPITRWRRI